MLGPRRLAELADHLRAHGYSAGPQQVVVAARLLAALPRPVPDDALAPWLAPIFCTSGLQQRDFGKLYCKWLADTAAVGDQSNRLPHLETPNGPGGDNRLQRWRIPPRHHLVLVVGAVVVALAVAFAVLRPAPDNPATPADVTTRTTSGSTIQKPPPPVAVSARAVALDAHIVAAVPVWAAMLAATAAIVRLRRRGFLERQPNRAERSELLLRTAAQPALRHWRAHTAALARTLRRRTQTASRELDVMRTLVRYCRTGVLSELFFGSRQEPHYVVIIERRGKKDHFARVADELVHTLRDAHNVHIEAFEYADTPLVLTQQQTGRERMSTATVVELADLPQRFPHAKVILFSDGSSLIGLHGGPLPTLLAVARDTTLTIMTPRPRNTWTRREQVLAQARLPLVPLDEEGIELLGKLMTDGHAVPPPPADAGPTPAYLRNAAAMLDTIGPDDAAIEALLAALRADLRPAGFKWLCGCAAYPEIQWSLTIAVGTRLFPVEAGDGASRTELLVALSVLPWLRHGFMPDWLRRPLLAAMDEKDVTLVQHALLEYLHGLEPARERNGRNHQLRIAHLARHPWRDFVRGCRALLRGRPLPRPREDGVYLRFMARAPSPLAVGAGERIAQLFYQFGTPLGAPRSLPYVVAFLVPACALLLYSLQRTPEGKPNGDDPIPAPPNTIRGASTATTASEAVPGPATAVGGTETGVSASTITSSVGTADNGRPAPSTRGNPTVSRADDQPAPTSSVPEEDKQGAGTVGPDQIQFTKRQTGRMTRNYGPQYEFAFSVAAPPSVLKRIAKVTYRFDHSTFRQKTYTSNAAATGFAQSYLGWGCLQTIDVVIDWRAGPPTVLEGVPMCDRLEDPKDMIDRPGPYPSDRGERVQYLIREHCEREIDAAGATRLLEPLYDTCRPGTNVAVDGKCHVPCQRVENQPARDAYSAPEG